MAVFLKQLFAGGPQELLSGVIEPKSNIQHFVKYQIFPLNDLNLKRDFMLYLIYIMLTFSFRIANSL